MCVRRAGTMHASRLFLFLLENIGRSGIIEGNAMNIMKPLA